MAPPHEGYQSEKHFSLDMGGGGVAGRRAPRPETGGGGMWRGTRGKAERAKGRAGLETSGETVGK